MSRVAGDWSSYWADDENDTGEVKMVLTAPFCPLAGLITGQVRQAAAAVPGVKEATVTLLDEPWDPSWMKR